MSDQLVSMPGPASRKSGLVRLAIGLAVVLAGCGSTGEPSVANDASLDSAHDTAVGSEVAADDGPRVTTCPPEGSPDWSLPCEDGLSCPSTSCCGASSCVGGKWVIPACDKILCSGHACSNDSDCGGLDTYRCGFAGEPRDPTRVCRTTVSCDPGDGTEIRGCDGDTGVCMADGTCIHACQFDDSTAAPMGCAGKNMCNVAGVGRDSMTGKMLGVGYCMGGCAVDADCPSPSVCQTETMWCVNAKKTFAKKLGESCTSTDDCACLVDRTSKTGICADRCRVGLGCAAGFECDPMLPLSFDASGGFTHVPIGLGGRCLKTCVSDSDCTSPAHCTQSGGSTVRTCTVDAIR